jgi:AmiR/NasT family two-component response regulator
VIAERDQVTMDVAFAALRKHARDHNLKLGEVARAVIAGGSVDPGSVPPPPVRP